MPVAAVDIGTNTVRLLIADVVDGVINEVERVTTVTALGRGVDRTGHLSPKGLRVTLATLADYRKRLDAHHVEQVRIVATSASRDATNGPGFLESVAATMRGIAPHLITGVEEARLSYLGAAEAFPGLRRPLVIDIGGGSTEFVTADTATSIDIGSVRLTDRALPDRPSLAHQVAGARYMATGLFADVCVPADLDGTIGVAGTWTSLAAIALDLPRYDRARVHGSTLFRTQLERIVHDLAAMSLETIELIPSLDPARAPVILGGAIVALAAMTHLGINAVSASEHDLLDGLALSASVR